MKNNNKIKVLWLAPNMNHYKSRFLNHLAVDSNIDICVFPSEAEPFGLVGVEAYMHGKPVLAFSDSGGLKEVIKPLEPENIVDNEEQLANRMLFYEQHQNMVMDKAKDRINYAKINFSIKRMERNYYDIYKTLMVK